MEDLLRSQIRDSCRLALPEGLKDLMSDISREVLRAQPQNLYQFITDYLSALLVAREHLFIAARVCDDVCKNRCCAELEDELRLLSLSDEDVEKSLEIIKEYFSKGEVNEGNVLQKIVNETHIRPTDLPAIQNAVRCAFLRHQLNNTISIESSTADSELDETMLAAKHTLRIYKKATADPDINYNCVAAKIQAAYRAYGVRRKRTTRYDPHSRKEDAADKVHFKVKTDQLLEDVIHIHPKRCLSKCSSVSLAGSFLSLPLYKPYTSLGHSDVVEVEEVGEKEKERTTFDYVSNRQEKEPMENQSRDLENKGKKTISFHKFPKVVELDDNEVSDEAVEADYETEDTDEDVISEYYADEESINEQYGDEDVDDENFTAEDVVNENDEDVTDENYADGGVSDKQYAAKEDVDRNVKDNLPGSPINKGDETPESIVVSELKRNTESSDSFSEDLDEVQQNETQRIFESWSGVDDPEVNKDSQKEPLFVSPDDDEDKQVEDFSVEIKSFEKKGVDVTDGGNMKTIPEDEYFVEDDSENVQV